MICPECKCMKNHAFCDGCGKQTLEHSCICGNALSYYQKFCEKCGLAAPPKPTREVPVSEVA